MDMVSRARIRHLMRLTGKRAGRNAVRKLDALLEEVAREVILRAERKADIDGRATIQEEDIEKA